MSKTFAESKSLQHYNQPIFQSDTLNGLSPAIRKRSQKCKIYYMVVEMVNVYTDGLLISILLVHFLHVKKGCDHMCPSLHKPTIHRTTLKLTFYIILLPNFCWYITTMYMLSSYNLLFSSYTTVSVIQLKMYISRNVCFQFRIRTPFTNSPRTNHFVFDEYIQSSWTKLRQEVSSRGQMPSMT